MEKRKFGWKNFSQSQVPFSTSKKRVTALILYDIKNNIFVCNTSKKSFFKKVWSLRYMVLLFILKNSYYSSMHHLILFLCLYMKCFDCQAPVGNIWKRPTTLAVSYAVLCIRETNIFTVVRVHYFVRFSIICIFQSCSFSLFFSLLLCIIPCQIAFKLFHKIIFCHILHVQHK